MITEIPHAYSVRNFRQEKSFRDHGVKREPPARGAALVRRGGGSAELGVRELGDAFGEADLGAEAKLAGRCLR
jgi:hypothetical protein